MFRTALSSPEHLLHMTPSPAGEPIASTFYYVPGGEEQQNQHAPQHAIEARTPTANGPTDANMMDMMMMNMMMDDCNNNGGGGGLERFDYTTGCYAGLDEELFYNAKYESIHEEPAYSMYYTGELYYTHAHIILGIVSNCECVCVCARACICLVGDRAQTYL